VRIRHGLRSGDRPGGLPTSALDRDLAALPRALDDA
jgi:hypothetical protein